MPGQRKKRRAPSQTKNLEEQLTRAQEDIQTAEDKINSMEDCQDLRELAQVLKKILRSVDKALEQSHQYYRKFEKRDGALRNRIVKFWQDHNLSGYGFDYDEDLDPVDNLVMLIKQGTTHMKNGRAYVTQVREAIATGDDAVILAAAKRIDHVPHGVIPEDLREAVRQDLESILLDQCK